MNSELSKSSKCYGLYDDNEIIGFCAIIHFPHYKSNNIKKVHRIVILPDYQGIGLGRRFLETLGALYKRNGFRFIITTSSKSAIASLLRSKHFISTRCGEVRSIGKTSSLKLFNRTIRRGLKTVSIEYI